jgi:hypothetical protein
VENSVKVVLHTVAWNTQEATFPCKQSTYYLCTDKMCSVETE